MANIDTETSGLSELSQREDTAVAEGQGGSLDGVSTTAVPDSAPDNAHLDAGDIALSSSNLASESNSTLRPSILTTTSSGTSSSPSFSAPHPKKFARLDVNKKFLQKNSSSPVTSSAASANSPSNKAGSPAPRPTAQPSASHSRLVTTKLTAAPQPSTTTGPGWSRPSSVNHSAAPSPSPVANVNGPNSTALPAAPQLPHAGKIIQPQHRAAALTPAAAGSAKKEGSVKPVWGNVRSGVSPPDTRVQNDFPTAAEVANVTTSVRKAKLMDAKEAAENAAADKQARSVEADTFRGVHLDPNAHHWDEMEEDDDNFLDGVIEFGDGRQYKIQPADVPPSSQNEAETSLPGGEQATVPVSKEERFADDFDRSWPRSRTSPIIPPRIFPPHAQQHSVPPSPSSSHTAHSPQDPSRVLFNERSNRLEPYSSSHPSHRAGPGPGPHPMHRRGSHADSGIPFADSRGGRDLPPHSPASNVQLLQKQGVSSGDGPTRAGPFGPIPSGPSSFSKDRPRDRDGRRPPMHFTSGFDSSRGKDQLGLPSVSPGGRDSGREFMGEIRGRRLSNMGPPPIPPQSLRDRSKETGRQLPPHLSQAPPSLQQRLSSREPQPRPPSTVPSDSPSSRRPSFVHPASQSPVLSHVSATSDTPSQPLLSPTVDLEQAHKTAMHISAERAKQRRQQEEEEREKEKERARQKAEALAAKASASPIAETKPSEHEVTKFLEDAVKDAAPQPASTQPVLQRPPSLRPAPRSASNIWSPQSAGSATIPPAVEAGSWRSKTKGLPPSGPKQIHGRPSLPPLPATPKVPPPLLHGGESFAVRPDEDLEVVDFSDMGKFVGVPDSSEPAKEEVQSEDQSSRPPRPVAADFFDNSSTADPIASKSDSGPWRRKPSNDLDRQPQSDTDAASTKQREPAAGLPNIEDKADTTVIRPPTVPETLPSPIREKSVLPSTGPAMINGQPHAGRIGYKEAQMSALDDVMSRIKDAMMDGMQTLDVHKDLTDSTSGESHPRRPRLPAVPVAPKPSPKESKWVPPALRVRNHDFDQQPQEVFDATMPEPPRSPPPALLTCRVNLPNHKISRPLEPLIKRYKHKPSPDFQLSVLSINEPKNGINPRHFSLTDILFGKPQVYKGRYRYVVLLPGARSARGGHPRPNGTGPKVHLPSSPPKGVGAFGRPGGAVDQSTWRKSTVQPVAMIETASPDAGLNTISRSPPPEPVTNSGLLVSTESASTRSRSQPKMPAGLAVAFYRDSRVDSIETGPKSLPLVSFTVSSELEEVQQSKFKVESGDSQPSTLPSPAAKNVDVTADSTVDCSTDVHGTSELKSQPASPEFVPALVQSKAGSKSSEDSTDRAPITPPSQTANAAWTKSPLSFSVKDSPARAPDPEHLKAVWSQTSDKARVHAVNSLEGIADDLTALPFTLQDVKSEDGETPPPTGSTAPSRMSLHDVTRAFQQVPSSSSSSATQRSVPLSPSSANGPVARPPNFPYSLPPPNPNMRQSYAAYPSPIMSHTPSPTLMYSHVMAPSPVPSRMPVNGHSQMFNQPVWMPLPAPPNQPHGGMMRPVASPYPPQMMAYPSPGGPSMYTSHPPPNMQSPGSQPNGSAQARGRGIPPMSPALQHITAAQYPGSPVMMQTPGMHTHSYMSPVPAGRGQLRNDPTGQSSMQHPPPSVPHPASHPHPAPHPGYTPVLPASYVRSNWTGHV